MKNKIGITGESGFIGTSLRNFLKDKKEIKLIKFEDEFFNDKNKLDNFIKECDIIIHLAGMNRGEENEVYKTNVELAKKLTASLENKKTKVIYASSTQIYDLNKKDTGYGRGKREAGEILKEWAKKNNQELTILIIPNVYGPHCKPFYNSVVATFCYQLINNQEPMITGNPVLPFIYVYDLSKAIYEKIKEENSEIKEEQVKETKQISIGELLELLKGFKTKYIENKIIPKTKDHFEKSLFNTFRLYIENPLIDIKVNEDTRGYLCEIVKHHEGGQVFFSITKPGITRGDHYHTRKIERFCVVKGEAIIKLRHINSDKVKEFKVSGEKPTFIDMPIYHTHNIKNIGKEDLMTLFWISEIYNPDDPDTIYEEV